MIRTSAEPLKIVLVAACPFPVPRGTPVRIHRMAEALARRGHEIHVVTYHLGEALTEPPFLVHRIDPVPSYRKTSPGPTYRKLLQVDRRLAVLLGTVLRSREIDLVHAHHYEGLLVALRQRRRRLPVIYDAHTILQSELPYYRVGLPGWFKRGVGVLLDRYLPRLADHTIAVTDEIRDTLLRFDAVGSDRISVVSNGVESELFEVPAKRWRDGVAEHPRVVFAGNLAAYQGVDLLLHAFAGIRARWPMARLVIATQSPVGEIETLAETLGIGDALDFEPVGFSELPAVLARSDVAVSPRQNCEGIPQKLLNYMAAGLPVVAFEGSAALIRHEVTGLRVPNGDVAALGRALDRVLGDRSLAERLGGAGQREVRTERSWDATAKAIESVYHRVLSASRQQPG